MTMDDFSREDEIRYGARSEGFEEGKIIGFIQALLEMGLSTEIVMRHSMRHFDLSQETAQAYVDEHYRVH